MLELKKGHKLINFENEIKKIGKKIYSWQKNKKNKQIINIKKFKLLADSKADILIKKSIKKFFGQSIILSEENKINKFSPSFWLIDPIDGTRSFYNNFKGYVLQVAYIFRGKPIYSIIYAPALNKIWTASLNSGSYLNGKKIVSNKKMREKIRIIDNYPLPTGIAKIIKNKIKNSKYLECGSIGLKAAMVCDDSADIFIKDIKFKDWDIMPALLLNHEVGNTVCDLEGKEITISKGLKKNKGLIVCKKGLKYKILRMIKNAKKK